MRIHVFGLQYNIDTVYTKYQSIKILTYDNFYIFFLIKRQVDFQKKSVAIFQNIYYSHLKLNTFVKLTL